MKLKWKELVIIYAVGFLATIYLLHLFGYLDPTKVVNDVVVEFIVFFFAVFAGIIILTYKWEKAEENKQRDYEDRVLRSLFDLSTESEMDTNQGKIKFLRGIKNVQEHFLGARYLDKKLKEDISNLLEKWKNLLRDGAHLGVNEELNDSSLEKVKKENNLPFPDTDIDKLRNDIINKVKGMDKTVHGTRKQFRKGDIE